MFNIWGLRMTFSMPNMAVISTKNWYSIPGWSRLCKIMNTLYQVLQSSIFHYKTCAIDFIQWYRSQRKQTVFREKYVHLTTQSPSQFITKKLDTGIVPAKYRNQQWHETGQTNPTHPISYTKNERKIYI